MSAAFKLSFKNNSTNFIVKLFFVNLAPKQLY